MKNLLIAKFFRGKQVKIGLIALLVAGLLSLWVGRQFLQKNKENLIETQLYQQEQFKKGVVNFKAEIGYMLYYAKFSLANQLSPLAGLSIGQRDVNANIMSLTIRGIEAQKYDADFQNPFHLLSGNFDFGFVLISLFPLLIIGFCYNIISEEKEEGTWKILLTQSSHPFAYILAQFGIRLLTVLALMLLLLLLSMPLLGIKLDAAFGLFTSAAAIYVLVWFGICFWIASLQKSSNFNALSLLAIWILLVIVLPAMLKNYLNNAYPVPEALATTLKQRKAYHEKWDMDQAATLAKFTAHYPQFKKYPFPSGDFSWPIYYAMQQMGDDESALESAAFQQKLAQRNSSSYFWAQFAPTMHLQLQLNKLAHTSMDNQLRFYNEATRFHENLRLHFYPKIFENIPSTAENWEARKIEEFQDNTPVNQPSLWLPLLLFAGLFITWGWFNFQKIY